MNTLPNKLSDLVELALSDLEKAEKSPDYAINMEEWHNPNSETGTCSVCLAGSVLAFSLGVNKSTYADPLNSYPHVDRPKLYALNQFRAGYVYNASCALGVRTYCPHSDMQQVSDYVSYEEDPEGFKAWSLREAKRLREEGL